jgi:hypothetical protein
VRRRFNTARATLTKVVRLSLDKHYLLEPAQTGLHLRPAQHQIAGLPVEDRALHDAALDGEFHPAADLCQRPQTVREHDAD